MRESREITIRMIPVISAFFSAESGVRGVEGTLGWGLGADRVVLLGGLLDVRALLEGVFLAAVTLLERVEVERGFAVVLVFDVVVFLLVVRFAINTPR